MLSHFHILTLIAEKKRSERCLRHIWCWHFSTQQPASQTDRPGVENSAKYTQFCSAFISMFFGAVLVVLVVVKVQAWMVLRWYCRKTDNSHGNFHFHHFSIDTTPLSFPLPSPWAADAAWLMTAVAAAKCRSVFCQSSKLAKLEPPRLAFFFVFYLFENCSTFSFSFPLKCMALFSLVEDCQDRVVCPTGFFRNSSF